MGRRANLTDPNAGMGRPDDRYRRLSGQEVERKIGEIRRGRFKVLIGAAPGVENVCDASRRKRFAEERH